MVRSTKESQRAMGTYFLSSKERWVSKDSKRNSASEGHPRTVEHSGRDKSGRPESQRARDTHSLSSAERGTVQDSERKPVSERRETLTSYPAQRSGQVRTVKDNQQAKDTHSLSSVE